MNKNLYYNAFNDDLTMRNYMALMACILNPRLRKTDALKIFGIRDNDKLEVDPVDGQLKKVSVRNQKYRNKIRVKDVISGEEKICESIREAEVYTKVDRNYIYTYMKKDIAYKKRYKFYVYKEA